MALSFEDSLKANEQSEDNSEDVSVASLDCVVDEQALNIEEYAAKPVVMSLGSE